MHDVLDVERLLVDVGHVAAAGLKLIYCTLNCLLYRVGVNEEK